jgi:hypothetical protein
MTEEQLMLYRLNVRVQLLERAFYTFAVSALMNQGATPEQAHEILSEPLEQDATQILSDLPGLSRYKPAQNALLMEEFREIVSDLKALIKSYS